MSAICHRFFFALLPPLWAANEIERLSSTLGLGRRVLKSHFHITLAITPDYAVPPNGLAEKMMRMPSDLLLLSFALVLDRLSGSPTSLALCPQSKPDRLFLLQRQLQCAFVRSGLLQPQWRFNPHLTLLYRGGERFSRPIPQSAGM